jgi:SAM-dependent methyltransferase
MHSSALDLTRHSPADSGPAVAANRVCGDEDVAAGRIAIQRGWYVWAATLVAGQSVLDAGCGLGYGIPILAETAASVRGQDLDPRLASEHITIGPLEAFPSKSVDVVVSVDVVEHVEADAAFVRELARIARRRVILTTPNWTASRCAWSYHVREYTPGQLRALGSTVGVCTLWKGTSDGEVQYPITYPVLNHVFNTARAIQATALPARALNVALPTRAKIHSHLAAVIDLQQK